MKNELPEDDNGYDGPSKSQRKRDSQSLQDLGVALVALRDDQLAGLPLPDRLRDAIMAARTIKSRGALHRQQQYIGKIMRKVDYEAIQLALENQIEQQKILSRRLTRVVQRTPAPGALTHSTKSDKKSPD